MHKEVVLIFSIKNLIKIKTNIQNTEKKKEKKKRKTKVYKRKKKYNF